MAEASMTINGCHVPRGRLQSARSCLDTARAAADVRAPAWAVRRCCGLSRSGNWKAADLRVRHALLEATRTQQDASRLGYGQRRALRRPVHLINMVAARHARRYVRAFSLR
jgi:hypothetical protein